MTLHSYKCQLIAFEEPQSEPTHIIRNLFSYHSLFWIQTKYIKYVEFMCCTVTISTTYTKLHWQRVPYINLSRKSWRIKFGSDGHKWAYLRWCGLVTVDYVIVGLFHYSIAAIRKVVIGPNHLVNAQESSALIKECVPNVFIFRWNGIIFGITSVRAGQLPPLWTPIMWAVSWVTDGVNVGCLDGALHLLFVSIIQFIIP